MDNQQVLIKLEQNHHRELIQVYMVEMNQIMVRILNKIIHHLLKDLLNWLNKIFHSHEDVSLQAELHQRIKFHQIPKDKLLAQTMIQVFYLPAWITAVVSIMEF